MSHTAVPCVLTVAGSDPSGGAGLQADLKTLTRTGVYGAAAVTAITVQNSLGVSRVVPLDPELVAAQVRAVIDDLNVSVIKTGMMGSPDTALSLAAILADFNGLVVCDPVIRASDATDLSRDPGLTATRELISRATVITPNRSELELLSGEEADTTVKAEASIKKIFQAHPRLTAVILKGGHFHEEKESVCDRLYLKDEEGNPRESALHKRPRLKVSPHGTGCVFASALAGFLAADYGIVPAFGKAEELMDELLAATFTVPGEGAPFINPAAPDRGLKSSLPGHSPGRPR